MNMLPLLLLLACGALPGADAPTAPPEPEPEPDPNDGEPAVQLTARADSGVPAGLVMVRDLSGKDRLLATLDELGVPAPPSKGYVVVTEHRIWSAMLANVPNTDGVSVGAVAVGTRSAASALQGDEKPPVRASAPTGPLTVPCPRCGALAGHACDKRTLGGRPFHHARTTPATTALRVV